ncbi:MAG: PH domain-containing protein [Prevotella sp.]|nr:PH domain-containing protein [Prevotella sp.]
MKTVYPTKVSVTLVLIISIIMGCIFYLLATGGKWIPFFINLLIYVSVLYLLVAIKYEINESQLIIHQAMGKMVIDISAIKSIEPTHTILSAPAGSLDRLRISYNKYDEIIISPRRKEEFIRQLQSINPNIAFMGKE